MKTKFLLVLSGTLLSASAALAHSAYWECAARHPRDTVAACGTREHFDRTGRLGGYEGGGWGGGGWDRDGRDGWDRGDRWGRDGRDGWDRGDRWGRGGDRWGRDGRGGRDGRIGDRDGRIGDRDGRIGDRDGRDGGRNGRRGNVMSVMSAATPLVGSCFAEANCQGEVLDQMTGTQCAEADGQSFAINNQCL